MPHTQQDLDSFMEPFHTKQREAIRAILEVFLKHEPDYDLNRLKECFHRPEQWRYSNFGKDSVLVTSYEGNMLQPFMSLDGFQYALVDEVQQALHKVGMRHEECYRWHGAVYLNEYPKPTYHVLVREEGTDFLRDTEEGPFSSQEDAEKFAESEVGVEYYIVKVKPKVTT